VIEAEEEACEAAPVVAGQPDPLEPEDVEEGDDVGRQVRLQVAAAGRAGPAEAAEVGADHPVALAERADQPPPRVPVLGPAVEHHERFGIGRARRGDMDAEPADVVEGMLDCEAGNLRHGARHRATLSRAGELIRSGVDSAQAPRIPCAAVG
jgi:hypothetical protein